MSTHHEILTWLIGGLFIILLLIIVVNPRGARHYHNPGPVDPNWRQQPYIRVRIALAICALVLGVIAIFFATP